MRKYDTSEVLAIVPVDKGLRSNVVLERFGEEEHARWLKRTTSQLETLLPVKDTPQEEFPKWEEPAFPTGVVAAIPRKARIPRVRFVFVEILQVADEWHVWIFPGVHIVIPK